MCVSDDDARYDIQWWTRELKDRFSFLPSVTAEVRFTRLGNGVYFFTMALRHPARSLTISMPQVLEAYGTQNLKVVIPQMEIVWTILRLDGMDKR